MTVDVEIKGLGHWISEAAHRTDHHGIMVGNGSMEGLVGANAVQKMDMTLKIAYTPSKSYLACSR